MMRVGEKGPALLNEVKWDIVPYTKGKGIDVGRGEYKAFKHFIGVREKSDDTIKEPVTADFLVDSFDNMADFVDGELDFVFVWGDAAIGTQGEKLLKVGGYLITAHASGNLQIARKVSDEEWHCIHAHRPEKSALVIRYGAIGDMMQTASVLPELKRQGYHVTLNCHTDGEHILKHDPHIDAFLTQDKDQVPNEELNAYWQYLEGKFDKVINLCESVEGTLLLHPGRSNHRWPHSMRKKYCNKNYLAFMAEIAELPYHPEYQFYPTKAEQKQALSILDGIDKQVNAGLVLGAKSARPFTVMWALAGSSVHKFYPHQDAVIARILTDIPNAHIILVGDEASHILEAGWENEARVHCYSGKLGLRDALTLAKLCNLVIGPETGVLNAVAFETNAKIVLLSHSTEENLSRDWTNTESMASKVTPCYPCHRLHYNHAFCPQDKETGASQCQVDLSPADVWEAVQRAYIGWGTVRQLVTP